MEDKLLYSSTKGEKAKGIQNVSERIVSLMEGDNQSYPNAILEMREM